MSERDRSIGEVLLLILPEVFFEHRVGGLFRVAGKVVHQEPHLLHEPLPDDVIPFFET